MRLKEVFPGAAGVLTSLGASICCLIPRKRPSRPSILRRKVRESMKNCPEAPMESLTIGKVAGGAGVNVETVRYYERRRLIEQPTSRRGAYRVYPSETVGRILSIKRAQRLGFSLDEIKELLAMRSDARARCGNARVQAERKMTEIEEKIKALRAVKKSLGKLADACRRELPVTECPILKNLSGVS